MKKSITLALEPNLSNMPIIKMKINDVWMHFIVDTGAMASIVSPQVVANARMKRIATAETHGIGGRGEDMPIYKAKFNLIGISIDSLTVSGTFGVGFSQRRNYGMDIHGLIGQDVLGKFSSYCIDNKLQRITFNK